MFYIKLHPFTGFTLIYHKIQLREVLQGVSLSQVGCGVGGFGGGWGWGVYPVPVITMLEGIIPFLYFNIILVFYGLGILRWVLEYERLFLGLNHFWAWVP